MRKYLIHILLLLSLSFAATASQVIGNEQLLLSTVTVFKNIFQSGLNEKQALAELDRIPQAKPYFKEQQYVGHRVFADKQLVGLLRVSYKDNKPILAAFNLVPLRVRNATKTYQFYRETLLKHYREISRNRFDLGNGIIAELDKKQRAIAVYVQWQ